MSLRAVEGKKRIVYMINKKSIPFAVVDRKKEKGQKEALPDRLELSTSR
jgi:hypothetical protein